MDPGLPSPLSSQSRSEHLSGLVRYGDAQSRLLNCPLSSMAEVLVTAIAALTNAQGACLVKIDDEEHVTLVASTTALPPFGAIHDAMLATVRNTGAPLRVNDSWAEPSRMQHRRDAVRSISACPIYATGADLLIVTAWHEHPNTLDGMDTELAAQLGSLARHRWESRSTGVAKAALTALTEDLGDSVIITEGSDARITFTSEAARTILSDRPNRLVGLPATHRRWVWRTANGEILTELPQQTVQRTGKAIYDHSRRLLSRRRRRG